MQIYREPLNLHLDLATHFRLRGCAFDTSTFAFPENLHLRAHDGRTLPISPKDAVSLAPIQTRHDLPGAARLSFDINLFDLFNMNAGNISLVDGAGEVLWDMERDLRAFPQFGQEPMTLPQQMGKRQLLFLVSETSPLAPILERIFRWQPALGQLRNTSGVAISVLEIKELSAHKKALMQHDTVLVIDEGCFPIALRESPSLMCSSPIILMRDNKLRFDSWLGGMPQVLSKMADLNDQTAEIAVFRLMTYLCGYNELFFPNGDNIFVYHSGQADQTIRDYAARELQQQSRDPLVLISQTPIHDLRQIRTEPHTLMVNIRAMRHTMDVFTMEGYDFVKEVLRRGVKIRKIVLGAEI